MALPNSEKITSQLALMPDQALKQMAMMHKADPYILPLIISEDGRRKQMRQAAMARMAMPQPKVADADVASIGALPEQQGIAQLQTPNIERMADGGIAGYDDGGLAEGGGPASQLAFNNEPVMRMAGGGAVQKYADTGLVKSTIQQIEDANISALNPLAQQFKQAEQQFIAAARSGDQSAIAQYMQVKEGLRKQLEQAVSSKFGNAAPKVLNQLLSAQEAAPSTPATPVAPASPVAPAVTDSAPKPVVNTPAPPPAAPAAPAAAGADTGGPSLKNTPTPMNTGLGNLNTMVGDARRRFLRDANSTIPEDKSIEEILAQRRAMLPEGKAMEGYEASIKKEEAAEPEEKKQAGLMALTQGFLAVAAGKSPNALSNIAEGLGVGLKDYGEALKEFKKAGKERQKQMADIENARRAEARGDVDKASSMYESAQDREQRRRASIDAGLASLEAHGISGAYSLAGHEISGKYSLAGHQISANAQKDWMKEVKGGQLVETAMKDLRAQIARSNKYGTPEEQEAEFQKRWPEMLQMNPNLAKYAGSVGGGTAVDTTGFRVLR